MLTWRPMLALREPGQPHKRKRSPLRPSTRSSSFVQLLMFFLTGSVPASTCPLYAPYFWLSLYSDELLQTIDMLDDTTLHLSPAVGDPSDSLNRRARS